MLGYPSYLCYKQNTHRTPIVALAYLVVCSATVLCAIRFFIVIQNDAVRAALYHPSTQSARSKTKHMAKFNFEREARTPFSECYTVLDDEATVGRLDIHFADVIVHATLTVSESLTTDRIQDLIDAIDEELLDAVGIIRQEIIVHVHQGRDLGVYSARDFEGTNGGGLRLN